MGSPLTYEMRPETDAPGNNVIGASETTCAGDTWINGPCLEANPSRVTTARYVPGATFEKTNSPLSLLRTVQGELLKPTARSSTIPSATGCEDSDERMVPCTDPDCGF